MKKQLCSSLLGCIETIMTLSTSQPSEEDCKVRIAVINVELNVCVCVCVCTRVSGGWVGE